MDTTVPARELNCRCGRTHVLPAEAAGCAYSCPHCGDVLYLPTLEGETGQVIPIVGQDELDRRAAQAETEAARNRSGQLLSVTEAGFESQVHIEDAHTLEQVKLAEDRRRRAGLTRDMVWSLLLFTDPRNLPRLLTFWVLLALEVLVFVAPLGNYVFAVGLFGLAFAILTEFALAGYLARTLDGMIEGCDELPPLPSMDEAMTEWPREMLEPAMLFGAGTAAALGPVLIVYSIAQANAGANALPSLPALAVSGALLMCGLCLWPMTTLVSIQGDVLHALRIDLIARSIRATLGAYVRVLLFTLGVGAVGVGGLIALFAPNPPIITNPLAIAAVVATVRTLTQFPIVRAIGAYGHRYQDRFAWDWNG